MHRMILSLLAVFIFSNAEAADIKAEQNAGLQKKEQSVYLQNTGVTFTPYRASGVEASEFVWVTSGKAQENLKASLVGVNINTWLENPLYFGTLQKLAGEFSV